MFIVFILCISSDSIVLRLVSVLYSLMVEKAESLLRGQWSAFNIYRSFSSPPSRLLRLVFASRFCVSSVLLVSSSRCRLLVVASCRSILLSCLVFVFASCSWRMRGAMSSVCRLMSVASRRGRLVFLYLAHRVSRRWCIVSVLRLVLIRPVLLLSPSVSGEAACVGRGGDAIVIMWSGRWRSVLVFLIGSAGRGGVADGERAVLFSSISPIRIHKGGFVLMAG